MRCVTALLVLTAALAIASCGDDGGKTTTIVQTTSAPASTSEAGGTTATTTTTTTAPQSLTAFQSPSRNIGCVASDGFARCDVRDRAWQPPAKPAGCEVDYGQGLSIRAGEAAALVCAGDTALDSGAPVLEYGASTKLGLVRCESAQAGITCRDEESGRGFFISRESYKLL